jgi:hypothetical protein
MRGCRRLHRSLFGLLVVGLAIGCCGDVMGAARRPPTPSEVAAIAARQRSQKTSFTDSEIIDGFLRTAFGAEYHLAGRVDRIRKYQTAVRVFVDPAARADRRIQFAGVVADIAARIQHLDIALAADRADANLMVAMVRDRDLARTMGALYGRERARDIGKSLDPQCLSGFRKNDAFEIIGSDVLLPVDAGDFIFFDCAYEELLQALGPINDTSAVPWTMFNDDVQMGFFDLYDQYILNILYDPRIRAGMTVAEVRAVLPQVLPDVRAFVAKVNGRAQ